MVITRFMRAYTNPTLLKKETPHLLEIQNMILNKIVMICCIKCAECKHLYKQDVELCTVQLHCV